MSKLTDNLDANFQLFIEEVRESGQVWGLRYGEDWVVVSRHLDQRSGRRRRAGRPELERRSGRAGARTHRAGQGAGGTGRLNHTALSRALARLTRTDIREDVGFFMAGLQNTE